MVSVVHDTFPFLQRRNFKFKTSWTIFDGKTKSSFGMKIRKKLIINLHFKLYFYSRALNRVIKYENKALKAKCCIWTYVQKNYFKRCFYRRRILKCLKRIRKKKSILKIIFFYMPVLQISISLQHLTKIIKLFWEISRNEIISNKI